MLVDVLVVRRVSRNADRYESAASDIGDGRGSPVADDSIGASDLGLKLSVVEQPRTLAVDRRASCSVLDEHLVLGVAAGKAIGPADQSLEGVEVGAHGHQDAAHSSGPTRTEPG